MQLSKPLIKLVSQANHKFNLIKEGDKIIVGFSGGKDSLALIHILKNMQKYAPFNFTFKAISIDYGMGEDLSFLTKHCAKFSISHEIIKTNIYKLAKQKIRKNSSYCSFFSRLRRGHLYQKTQEYGYNKLALGHHFDDAVESFFMGFSYNGVMRSMAPKYTSSISKDGYNIEVIRPLIFVRERMLVDNAKINNAKTITDELCPAMRFDIKLPHTREATKKLLAQMEKNNPKLFTSLKSSFSNIQKNTFF
jgi:tRNA(Ile)-lysidine synthase TilS/MesJ